MTEAEVATVAAYLLDLHLDRHWRFEFRDSLPVRGGSRKLAGHTSWDRREIVVSREVLPSLTPETLGQLILHEIAHALTPEDWTHGDIFRAKLATLR